jgi:hypothetical protein
VRFLGSCRDEIPDLGRPIHAVACTVRVPSRPESRGVRSRSPAELLVRRRLELHRFLRALAASESRVGLHHGPGAIDWSDRRWAYWARRVPGGWAGGPYYPWPRPIDAPLTILLRDTTKKEAALAALDTLLPPHARRSPTAPVTIAARQARWDLAELFDWKDFIVSNFGRAEGVSISMWGLGPDRLTIGIKDLESLPATIRWLHELRVPCRLVMVEVVGTVSTLPRTGR